MLSAMNSVVQALVWTTIAGLLYMVWLRGRAGSTAYKFELTSYWEQTLRLLRTMWMLLAIGLIISLLVFAWPQAHESTANAAPPCVAANSAANADCVAGHTQSH